MSKQSAVAEAVARCVKRVEEGVHSEEAVAEGSAMMTIPEAKKIATATGRYLQPVDAVRRAVFLQALAEKPVVSRAAAAAGIQVSSAYRLRQKDPAFAAAWDDAAARAAGSLEERAYDRAMEKSDKLMELMLKGNMPEKYREKLDVAVSNKTQIVVDLVPGAFVPSGPAGAGSEEPEDVLDVELINEDEADTSG